MKHAIAALMATALMVPAFGQGPIKEREQNQTDRIHAGVQNGTLTRPEAARLRQQQRDIRQDVRQDKRDGGGLTAREKGQITREQNRASRNIHRQKHDGQNRK
ncbi:MAG: hypothetical protein WDO18_15875 [Acidobacteriota bacterium]